MDTKQWLLKYPSMSRPELFKSTMEKYCQLADDPTRFRFVFSFEDDDKTMYGIEDFLETLKYRFQIEYHVYREKSGTKISAVNNHVNDHLDDIDLVYLVSDDMIPQQKGFDTKIETLLFEAFPDGDGVLHINDGLQGPNLNTLSIMGKRFYDRFGYFYHPDYESCFPDNEFTELSYAMKKVRYVPEVIVRHEWVGHTLQDELHWRNHMQMKPDAKVYQKRKALGFPKKSVLTS